MGGSDDAGTREPRGPAPLRCAHCREFRPDDDSACPACGKPRFRHKTASPEEFWEHRRELDERGR